MRTLTIVPGTRGVKLQTTDEPAVPGREEVKLQVLEVGICGTDREEASGGRALAPDGRSTLVIGHEMLGRVMEVGSAVTQVAVGDLAVLSVRRGCSECLPCRLGRSDMCRTGRYRERGIWGLDGYQNEFVVDSQEHVIRLDPGLRDVGVLCEPLSIVEKAIHEGVRVQQARLPDAGATPCWLAGRRCLVAGLGPVGLLAAMALRLRGADICGLDIVPPGSPRAAWLEGIGGTYVSGAGMSPEHLGERIRAVDLVFEAAGIPDLAFDLIDLLAPGGIYLVTGIPGGESAVRIPGAELLRRMVLNNQVMMGSVNAAVDHFRMAAADIAAGTARWPGLLPRLITHRYTVEEAPARLLEHAADEIKGVVAWDD